MSTNNEKQLTIGLITLSGAIVNYLEFDRNFHDGLWAREDLEICADARDIFYNYNTSSWDIFCGIKSSMSADLLQINQTIQDNINYDE